jgi:hypothetical protein
MVLASGTPFFDENHIQTASEPVGWMFEPTD